MIEKEQIVIHLEKIILPKLVQLHLHVHVGGKSVGATSTCCGAQQLLAVGVADSFVYRLLQLRQTRLKVQVRTTRHVVIS